MVGGRRAPHGLHTHTEWRGRSCQVDVGHGCVTTLLPAAVLHRWAEGVRHRLGVGLLEHNSDGSLTDEQLFLIGRFIC